MNLKDDIKAEAHRLGFDLAGIARPGAGAATKAAFRDWILAGMHGEMAYMAREDRVARTLDPDATLPGVRSLVVVGKNYFAGDLAPELRDDPSRGLIASYAWAKDYHEVLGPRLQALADYVAGCRPGTATRAYIDTGPLLERDAAARAGLGFVGRNTMLIHPGWGSWLFLGVLLTDLDLEPDPPGEGTCGRCTRCLEACPTDAFPRPHVLDARRCISYLTIELKGPIPRHLRSALGNRIFGCDICNEVCPYNRRLARSGPDPALVPRVDWVAPRLLDLVGLDEAGFRGRFRGSPVLRPKRRGFLRNVCVALGNWGAPEAVDALGAAADDAEALIRGHAVWALGRIGTASATNHLMRRRKGEADSWVLEEIDLALQARDRRSGA